MADAVRRTDTSIRGKSVSPERPRWTTVSLALHHANSAGMLRDDDQLVWSPQGHRWCDAESQVVARAVRLSLLIILLPLQMLLWGCPPQVETVARGEASKVIKCDKGKISLVCERSATVMHSATLTTCTFKGCGRRGLCKCEVRLEQFGPLTWRSSPTCDVVSIRPR